MGKKHNNIINRTLITAEGDSVYGIIIKPIGGNKFQVYCSDRMMRIASIRGSMVKRVWMKERDIVLCSLREGNGKYCDIELKYTDSELKTLRDTGHITNSMFNQEKQMSDTKIDFSLL